MCIRDRIYLGGNEQSTHKYISEQLGKETISTKSSSQSKGRNGSYSQSTQQMCIRDRDQAPRTLRQTSQGVSGNAPSDTVQ